MNAYDESVLTRAQEKWLERQGNEDYPFFIADDGILTIQDEDADIVILALKLITAAREDIILDQMIREESDAVR